MYNVCVCVCICMYLTQAKAEAETKRKQAEEVAQQKAAAEAKVRTYMYMYICVSSYIYLSIYPAIQSARSCCIYSTMVNDRALTKIKCGFDSRTRDRDDWRCQKFRPPGPHE